MIITATNFNAIGHPEISVDIKFTRRVWKGTPIGGWVVRRRDNNRALGWVCKTRTGTWEARIADEAFRGEGDDLGDVLDEVPGDLTRCYDGHSYEVAATGHDRYDAVWCLVHELVRNGAPGVGFPRHRRVTVWADRKTVGVR